MQIHKKNIFFFLIIIAGGTTVIAETSTDIASKIMIAHANFLNAPADINFVEAWGKALDELKEYVDQIAVANKILKDAAELVNQVGKQLAKKENILTFNRLLSNEKELDEMKNKLKEEFFWWKPQQKEEARELLLTVIDILQKNLKEVIEEQLKPLLGEQDGNDPISFDDIRQEPADKLIILGEEHPRLFLKKTIMDHMISKVGSEEGILDPFTRQTIPIETQIILLKYFSLPTNLLTPGGPIYKDARDLQERENWIVMAGEPETEEKIKDLEELKYEANFYRKRIRDTLARYNYNYAE